MKSGVPKSTIGNVINCACDSVKLRIIHELCQGLGIGIPDFLHPPVLMKRCSKIKSPTPHRCRAFYNEAFARGLLLINDIAVAPRIFSVIQRKVGPVVEDFEGILRIGRQN